MQICCMKTRRKMEGMERRQVLFAALLEDEKVLEDATLDFGRLCLMMKVDRREMDRYLMDELGFSGEEILASYRSGSGCCFEP